MHSLFLTQPRKPSFQNSWEKPVARANRSGAHFSPHSSIIHFRSSVGLPPRSFFERDTLDSRLFIRIPGSSRVFTSDANSSRFAYLPKSNSISINHVKIHHAHQFHCGFVPWLVLCWILELLRLIRSRLIKFLLSPMLNNKLFLYKT